LFKNVFNGKDFYGACLHVFLLQHRLESQEVRPHDVDGSEPET
jgi:hypothetical protein